MWEGFSGSLYLIDGQFRVERTVPVLAQPGARYAFLSALADPTFPDSGARSDLSDSGKLMALDAYGAPENADAEVTRRRADPRSG